MAKVIRMGTTAVIAVLLIVLLVPLVALADVDIMSGRQFSVTRPSAAAIPQAPEGAAAYNVLWDLTHGVYLSYEPSGDYAGLVALLATEGFTVTTTAAGIHNIDLSGYDIIVISVGGSWDSPYTAPEVTAVQNFITGGGAILVMGENTDCPNEHVNPITEAFGTTCGVSYLASAEFDNLSGHSMFDGITIIHYVAAGELAATSPSSEEAWDPDGFPTVTSMDDCRMIVTGDCNFCDDSYRGSYDNEAFILNVFHYLAQCGDQCKQPKLMLKGFREVDWDDPYWEVQVEVYNEGPGPANDVYASMNNDLAWLVIPDPNCYYGNIADGMTSWGDDSYTFDLTCSPGGPFNVWFDVSYRDECGNKYQVMLDPEFDRESTPKVSYELEQNYPNPFNPATVINFQIPRAGHVSLNVYDVSGRLVRRLVNGHRDAGPHAVEWNGKDDAGLTVASGIYFYKLNADNFVKTRRMVLLR